MKIEKPKFRCGGNIEELAELFNYEIDPRHQGWTYIIAETERLTDYIAAYDAAVTNPDTKFSLMEMILQALFGLTLDQGFFENWEVVKNILIKDFSLHEYTVFYWCRWEDDDWEEFEMIPPMRKFWLEQSER